MALTGREMTEAARQAVSKIPNDQLQSQLAAGASVVVLDVREKEEWDAGHIPQGTVDCCSHAYGYVPSAPNRLRLA